MADTRTDEVSIDSTWLALARLVAALAGASTTLIALCFHVHLLPACGRGAVAYLGARVLGRLGAAVLRRLPAPERLPARRPAEPSKP